MRQVIVMSGVSGCGKSTYANRLLVPNGYGKVVSADTFFMSDGVYRFDPSKLSAAHGACFRDFIATICMPGYEQVIVDNTNTTSEEISPYILGAQAYEWDVEIRTMNVLSVPEGMESNCTWFDKRLHKYAERNSHGVGIQAIRRQADNLSKRRLAPWWKNTDIAVDV